MRSRVSVFSYCRWRRPFGRCLPPCGTLWQRGSTLATRSCQICTVYSSRYKYAQKSEVQKVSESLCWRSLCLLVPQIKCAGPISGFAYFRLYLSAGPRGAGEGAAPSHAAPTPVPLPEIGLCEPRKTSGTLLYCCCCGPVSGIQEIWLLR